MAAPQGNQFWKLRSKHGRDKLFATPELMWEAACEYFNWCDAHPWPMAEPIKSGDNAGKLIKVPYSIPYTLEGFLFYIHAGKTYWQDFKKANHEDFSGVINDIELIIYNRKYTGAAVGAYNANLISRDIKLRDGQDLNLGFGEGADGEINIHIRKPKSDAPDQH